MSTIPAGNISLIEFIDRTVEIISYRKNTLAGGHWGTAGRYFRRLFRSGRLDGFVEDYDGKERRITSELWRRFETFRVVLTGNYEWRDDPKCFGQIIYVREDAAKAFLQGLKKPTQSVDNPTEAPSKNDEGREPKPRAPNPDQDAFLRNKYESVLSAARGKWKDPKKRPAINQMARLLIVDKNAGRLKEALEGLGFNAVRRILRGDYPPANRLGIGPL